jgi:hypothetical protein
MSCSFQRLPSALLALFSLSLVALTGCGAIPSFSNPISSTEISGKVYGGQQPISGSTITVWSIGLTGYGSAATKLAETTTDADGNFSFPSNAYTCLTPDTQVYITAYSGYSSPGYENPNILLATGLGDCSTAKQSVVEVNEVTTAATAYALAQFFTTTLGSKSTDSFGTDAADLNSLTLSNTATIPLLVKLSEGTVNPNTSTLTIESAKIYSIANTLSACVNDAATFSNCTSLYSYTTPPNGTAPTDTLQAAVQMALYPSQNVTSLFQLAPKQAPFSGLNKPPNDWTVAVSYTTSALGLGIAGDLPAPRSATSATIDIDAAGRIWIPTNLPGHTGIAYFDPSSATFNGPYLTGTFTHPQYVAIDRVTDPLSSIYGSIGSVDTTPPGTSATIYRGLSTTDYLGPIAADASGDIWFSYVSGRFPYLAMQKAGTRQVIDTFTYPPTGLVATSDLVYASTSGDSTACALESISVPPNHNLLVETSTNCTSGGVALFPGGGVFTSASSADEICLLEGPEVACGPPPSGSVDLPEGTATDGFGDLWFANSGNGSVFLIGGITGGNEVVTTYTHNATNGNTMTSPYAVAIDGSGNIWFANASCITTGTKECTPTSFTLSEIIGAAGPTITPLSAQMVGNGSLVGTRP